MYTINIIYHKIILNILNNNINFNKYEIYAINVNKNIFWQHQELLKNTNQYIKLPSWIRSLSLLQRNVPNRQVYKWSKIVIKKYSLNSKALGNCSVICHTQSINWRKTGERSASEWWSSPCPIRLSQKKEDNIDNVCLNY